MVVCVPPLTLAQTLVNMYWHESVIWLSVAWHCASNLAALILDLRPA